MRLGAGGFLLGPLGGQDLVARVCFNVLHLPGTVQRQLEVRVRYADRNVRIRTKPAPEAIRHRLGADHAAMIDRASDIAIAQRRFSRDQRFGRRAQMQRELEPVSGRKYHAPHYGVFLEGVPRGIVFAVKGRKHADRALGQRRRLAVPGHGDEQGPEEFLRRIKIERGPLDEQVLREFGLAARRLSSVRPPRRQRRPDRWCAEDRRNGAALEIKDTGTHNPFGIFPARQQHVPHPVRRDDHAGAAHELELLRLPVRQEQDQMMLVLPLVSHAEEKLSDHGGNRAVSRVHGRLVARAVGAHHRDPLEVELVFPLPFPGHVGPVLQAPRIGLVAVIDHDRAFRREGKNRGVFQRDQDLAFGIGHSVKRDPLVVARLWVPAVIRLADDLHDPRRPIRRRNNQRIFNRDADFLLLAALQVFRQALGLSCKRGDAAKVGQQDGRRRYQKSHDKFPFSRQI